MSAWQVSDFDLHGPVFFTGVHAEEAAQAYAQLRKSQGHYNVHSYRVQWLDITPEQASYSKTVYEISYYEHDTPEVALLKEIFPKEDQEDLYEVDARVVDVGAPHPIFGLCEEITDPVQVYDMPEYGQVLFIGTDPDAVLQAYREMPKKTDNSAE